MPQHHDSDEHLRRLEQRAHVLSDDDIGILVAWAKAVSDDTTWTTSARRWCEQLATYLAAERRRRRAALRDVERDLVADRVETSWSTGQHAGDQPPEQLVIDHDRPGDPTPTADPD